MVPLSASHRGQASGMSPAWPQAAQWSRGKLTPPWPRPASAIRATSAPRAVTSSLGAPSAIAVRCPPLHRAWYGASSSILRAGLAAQSAGSEKALV
ncbi:hypothetical protein D3C87_1857900 [compost metagenome]